MPNERLDRRYLAYFLRSPGTVEAISQKVAGARMPRADMSFVMSLPIPLPTLQKQQRLVELLSRAESIVRMRREAEQKAKEIIPALFLDMFGDPATNPKGWTLQAFVDLGTLDRGRSRHRPRDAGHLYGGAYPFVQTGDVSRSGGAITTFSQTYSDAGLAQSKLWPAGTLCITIAANIAETGILMFPACFPDNVVGFLPVGRVRTDYIQQWLGFLQPTLAAQAPQAAQKNINLEILRNLKLPVPPLAMQERFAERVRKIRSLMKSLKTAMGACDSAFRTLLEQSFV